MATSSPPDAWSSPTRGEPNSGTIAIIPRIRSHHSFIYLRAILHDPATYPEPSKFKPERFLDPAARALFLDAAFGFGRRKCPGRYLAWDTAWITMASMLAAFEFLPETDVDGRPALPAQEFTSLFHS